MNRVKVKRVGRVFKLGFTDQSRPQQLPRKRTRLGGFISTVVMKQRRRIPRNDSTAKLDELLLY